MYDSILQEIVTIQMGFGTQRNTENARSFTDLYFDCAQYKSVYLCVYSVKLCVAV